MSATNTPVIMRNPRAILAKVLLASLEAVVSGCSSK